jgi:hypothetical protein
MSTVDIQSWIATISDGGDTLQSFAWNKDNVLKEWPMAMIYAQMTLLTSATKRRIQFLSQELLFIATHSGWLR